MSAIIRLSLWVGLNVLFITTCVGQLARNTISLGGQVSGSFSERMLFDFWKAVGPRGCAVGGSPSGSVGSPCFPG